MADALLPCLSRLSLTRLSPSAPTGVGDDNNPPSKKRAPDRDGFLPKKRNMLLFQTPKFPNASRRTDNDGKFYAAGTNEELDELKRSFNDKYEYMNMDEKDDGPSVDEFINWGKSVLEKLLAIKENSFKTGWASHGKEVSEMLSVLKGTTVNKIVKKRNEGSPDGEKDTVGLKKLEKFHEKRRTQSMEILGITIDKGSSSKFDDLGDVTEGGSTVVNPGERTRYY